MGEKRFFTVSKIKINYAARVKNGDTRMTHIYPRPDSIKHHRIARNQFTYSFEIPKETRWFDATGQDGSVVRMSFFNPEEECGIILIEKGPRHNRTCTVIPVPVGERL